MKVGWNSYLCSWQWKPRFLLSGSTQFPYNPLTMRMLSSTPPTPIACAPSSVNQAAPHQQNRIWEREPAPLLSAQYETLSDSDDWTAQRRDLVGQGVVRELLFWVVLFLIAGQNPAFLWFMPRDFRRAWTMDDEEMMECGESNGGWGASFSGL